jgi:hypothetical protein
MSLSNKTTYYVKIIIILFSFFVSKDLYAKSIVLAKGFGENKVSALNDAKRNAVGQVCGEAISSNTKQEIKTQKTRNINQDGEVEKSINSDSTMIDENTLSVFGSIKSFKLKNEGEAEGNFFVEIEAIVSECPKTDVIQKAKNNKAILSELRQISSQIANLGNNSGVINEPKTYAQFYHNARIYAQRGDVDLALDAHEKLLGYPLQMADPLSDMITLGKRVYGLNGVKVYIDKKAKNKMPISSYLFAQILMIEPGYEPDFDFNKFASRKEWIESARQFPPLAYQILITMKPHNYEFNEKTWSEWKFYYDLFSLTKSTMDNGEFLSYYIDQIRAGSSLEIYSQEQISMFFDEFLFFSMENDGMPNIWDENLAKSKDSRLIKQNRIINIEKSPIVIDFTYYFESPMLSSRSVYFQHFLKVLHNGSTVLNPRENNLIRLGVWDPYIDESKPFYICATAKNGKEDCVDLNTEAYLCRQPILMGSERYQCLYIYGDSSKGFYNSMPNADSTFSANEWLKNPCISKISYTDGYGYKVEIYADDMIGTHRWPKGRAGNSEIENLIKQCGYQRQYTQFIE